MPIAIGIVSGLITRLDWTADGLEPRNGNLPSNSMVLDASRNHRFVLIRSDATNLAAEGGATGNYLVDRDADRDGVFDEFDARRILALPSGMQFDGSESIQGHRGKPISDDGRYVVSTRNVPKTAGNPGGSIVVLVDLDADGDGVLGSPLPVSVVTAVLNEIPAGDVLPRYSSRPSISANGRIVAWEEWQSYDVIGIDPVSGSYVWAFADGWPYSRRIFALDRDSDADGLLDETTDHETVDITANAPLFWSYGPCSGVTESGKFIVYPSQIVDESGSASGTVELFAFEFSSRRNQRWLPVDGGAPIAGNVSSQSTPHFSVHRGDRRVSFTAVVRHESETSALVAARLDRDPDGDGAYVEGDGVVQTFEVRDVPKSRVRGSSEDGSILISDIGFPPEAFAYDYLDPGLLLPDCAGEVHSEYPIVSQCPLPMTAGPKVSILGCPTVDEYLNVRVSTYSPTGGQVFLVVSPNVDFANWNHACGAYMLGGAATVLMLLPAPAVPGTMAGTLAVSGTFALPHRLQGSSFTLQGVKIEPSALEPLFGGRVVVTVR